MPRKITISDANYDYGKRIQSKKPLREIRSTPTAKSRDGTKQALDGSPTNLAENAKISPSTRSRGWAPQTPTKANTLRKTLQYYGQTTQRGDNHKIRRQLRKQCHGDNHKDKHFLLTNPLARKNPRSTDNVTMSTSNTWKDNTWIPKEEDHWV